MIRITINGIVFLTLIFQVNLAAGFFEQQDMRKIFDGSGIDTSLPAKDNDLCLMENPLLYLHTTHLELFKAPRKTLENSVDKLLTHLDQACPFPLERLVIYFDFNQHTYHCLSTKMIYIKKQKTWHLQNAHHSGNCDLDQMIALEKRHGKSILAIRSERQKALERRHSNDFLSSSPNRRNQQMERARLEAEQRAASEIRSKCYAMAERMAPFGVTCSTTPRR